MQTILPIDPIAFRVGTTLLVLAIAFFAYRVSRLWRGTDITRRYWEQSPEAWRGPAIFLGLLWLGLFALTVVAAYVGVWDMIHPAPGTAGQSGLGLGALLAAMLGSPFVIWGTWLKYQTVRFQKEGHMTDRISKAVEQLGAEKTVKVRIKDADGKEITVEETKPSIEVRIGAILSLERIAQDSTIHDKGRDHVRVMEILCAYLRENSPCIDMSTPIDQTPYTAPRNDLQLAANCILRRSQQQKDIEGDTRYRLDLRGVNFDFFDLSKGDLTAARLWKSRFYGSDLSQCNLTAAQLNSCLLTGAILFLTKLRGTVLNSAELRNRGNIIYRSLLSSDLHSAFIEGAKLPDLYITKHTSSQLFGSGDTVINESQEAEKALGLRIAEYHELNSLAENPADRLEVPTETPQSKLFAHWNYYTLGDGMSGVPPRKFQEVHQITGWPFDEL